MEIRSSSLTKWFLTLSGALLCLTALAKLYGAMGSARMLVMRDPLLFVNNRLLLIVVGLIEAGLACYLARSQGTAEGCRRGAAALLWLSSNFLAYRLGRFMLGVKVCPCLGTLSERLPLSPGFVDGLLATLALFWFGGSLLILRNSSWFRVFWSEGSAAASAQQTVP